MNTTPYLELNGVALPTPTSVDVELYDISTDEWTDIANGSVHFDLIWEDVAKLVCQWENVSKDVATTLLNIGKGGKLTLTYIDPITDNQRTGIFYRGNRKVSVKSIQDSKIYSISCNFIEKEH